MTAARNWYEFKAKGEAEVEAFIYDEIGGWGISAASFIADLRKHAGKSVTLRINSPGGVVTEGSAIFNALQRHKGGVAVQIDGLAASMAGYIAMAGAPVRMAQNAYLMLHNPSGGVFGGAEDMRSTADLLDKMKGNLAAAYVAKSGKTEEEVCDVMDAETWFTAEEAKDFGLIDEITDEVSAVASFDLTKFRNAPRVDNSRAVNMDEITGLTEKLNAAQAQAQKNFADFTAATIERDSANAKVSELTSANLDLATKLTDATAKIEAHAQELSAAKEVTTAAVNSKAIEILAASGHAPLNQKNGGSSNDKTMSLADFNALTPAEKSAFSCSGGKLTE